MYDTEVAVSEAGTIITSASNTVQVKGDDIVVRRGTDEGGQVTSRLCLDTIAAGALESIRVWGAGNVTVETQLLSHHYLTLSAISDDNAVKKASIVVQGPDVHIQHVFISACNGIIRCEPSIADHMLRVCQTAAGLVHCRRRAGSMLEKFGVNVSVREYVRTTGN